MRRRLAAAAAVVAAFAFTAGAVGGRDNESRSGSAEPSPAKVARLVVGERRLANIELAPLSRHGRLDPAAVSQRVHAVVPATLRVRRGRARLTYALDARATARRVLDGGPGGGAVQVVREVTRARTPVKVIRQALRNNCESAALSMLLAAAGRPVDQLELQQQFRRSGPLDPRGEGEHRVSVDPDEGYVGRPEGGGVAGGFGVYPGPVAKTAARRGVRVRNISGAAPEDLYDQLRSGRVIMAWVGLSDGPFGVWRSSKGRRIRVNFGEHTVVLTGTRADGSVFVANPLNGTAETWSRPKFELMWRRLGRRALAA